MSEENDLPEDAKPEGSEPERKFKQEHYDRLTKGQEPWREFLGDWEGEGDPWEAFEKDSPDEAAAIREAVEAWNAVLPQPAFLQWADLALVHLNGASLFKAHMEEADLFHAHLEGAGLTLANLRGAHMFGCDLKAAELTNADLEGVTGLTAGQLAGADVTSAKLPEDIKDFESLKVADEAAKNSRSLFLVMLVACVYSWLTLATTTDQALIMDTGSSPLPIIRVPVPIRGFFLAAPTFLLAAYVYFHLYLHGLWSRLAELPAVFPDGRPLDQRAYPWLLTSLVRPHFERLREGRPAFSKAKVGLSILLAWWVVPITIYLFWAQALSVHDPYMTSLHLALFVASLAVGVITYQVAVATLRLEDPPPPTARDVIQRVAAAGSGRIPIATVLLVLLSALALWGPRELPSVPVVFHPYADLTNAQLSTRTRPAFETDSIEVGRPDLQGLNLRFAAMQFAYLEGADLRGANLTRANLSGANLVRADLVGAHLREVFLLQADLREAILTADLRESILIGADLRESILGGADLRGANLAGANLSEADLTGADLTGAALRGADLTAADLRGADLTGANLAGADFTDADLDGADVTGVRDGSPTFWQMAARVALCRDPDTDELTSFEAPTEGGAPDICRR